MNSRIIEVVSFQTAWAQAFEQEKGLIQSALNESYIADIHHIGSTSVPGLCAKPIIDILMEVNSLEDLDKESHLMHSLGYEVKGEFGIPGRRYFQKGGIQRSHQVHAFLSGSKEANRHLAFKEYLIAFPAIAQAYGEIKQTGAAICKNDIEIYIRHKNAFIKEHEAKALEWKFGLSS